MMRHKLIFWFLAISVVVHGASLAVLKPSTAAPKYRGAPSAGANFSVSLETTHIGAPTKSIPQKHKPRQERIAVPEKAATTESKPESTEESTPQLAKANEGASNTIVSNVPVFSADYLHNTPPAYPPLAKRMRWQGEVLLDVLVNKNGQAAEVKVARSSGHDALDLAAKQAVERWRFVPAKREETPIDEWVQVPLVFRLANAG